MQTPLNLKNVTDVTKFALTVTKPITVTAVTVTVVTTTNNISLKTITGPQ